MSNTNNTPIEFDEKGIPVETGLRRSWELSVALRFKDPSKLDKGSRKIYDYIIDYNINVDGYAPWVIWFIGFRTLGIRGIDEVQKYCSKKINRLETLFNFDIEVIFESLDPDWDGWVMPTKEEFMEYIDVTKTRYYHRRSRN